LGGIFHYKNTFREAEHIVFEEYIVSVGYIVPKAYHATSAEVAIPTNFDEVFKHISEIQMNNSVSAGCCAVCGRRVIYRLTPIRYIVCLANNTICRALRGTIYSASRNVKKQTPDRVIGRVFVLFIRAKSD
jgi:hypothetical protein